MSDRKLLIYLADLAHDYQKMRQFVPLSVGFIAAYAYDQFGEDRLEIRLFKSADKLLDAIEERKPDLLGLSNYTWNLELSSFVARNAKAWHPDLPVIMGGPNIGTDLSEVEAFLREHEFVDMYTMYGSERPVADIIKCLLDLPADERTGERLRTQTIDRCCSLADGVFNGNSENEAQKELDFIPSPYTAGLLDEFLDEGMIPMFETNRGCPYSCTYCFWGVSALNKLAKFSLERVFADLDYVAHYGKDFSELYFCDANFGIIKRDVDVARHIRKLYDETQAFSSVIVYWSKAAQPHMIDIGQALGHLTTTYVAFQSLDADVLGAMKRKNINTEKLLHLIQSLKKYTHTPQTDILVGSPEETVESHLASLDKALSFGIHKINGGEIRMLPGTEMADKESREKFGIKTKYRLFEGGIGVYRGDLVYELEETIRATNTMSEPEMIGLRILRALFFGSVTLAEHWPLISFLTHNDVQFTQVLRDVIQRGETNPRFKKSLDWLQNEAEHEFFDTPEDIAQHLEKPDVRENLFGENAFLKLNFGYTARLILNDDEYDGYYEELETVLIKHTEHFSTPTVIREILNLCRSRNYLSRCLHNDDSVDVTMTLSPETVEALLDCEYLSPGQIQNADGGIVLAMDPVTARQIRQKLAEFSNRLNPFTISQILQMFWGRCHIEPKRKFTQIDVATPMRTTGFAVDPAASPGVSTHRI